MREGDVAFNAPDGRLRETRLNDAEHIHVSRDGLIRRFPGGAGAGEVAAAGQNREGFMLRWLGIIAGSRDGLGEHPVADDGVLFFTVVVLDRAQGSGKFDELAPLAGQ